MHQPNRRSLLTFAFLGTVVWIGQASGGDGPPQRVAAAAVDPAAGTSDARLVEGTTETIAELQPTSSIIGGRSYTEAPAPPKRYRTLLKTIEVPADRESYGDFYNFGYYAGTSYAGHDDLPPGYWVYVSPNWLIYRDAPGTPGEAASRSPHWEPTQAIGAPDTLEPGDRPTAWASQTPDGQREWLEVTFDAPQKAAALLVYESYNPGALDRVTVYSADGREAEVWAGVDPTKPTEASGVSAISIKAPFDVVRAKLHLNSPAVAGWNEIDAVGLVDAMGKTHWATGATASSTYADTARFSTVRELEQLRGTQVR